MGKLILMCILIPFSLSCIASSSVVGPELEPVSHKKVNGKPILLVSPYKDDFVFLTRTHESAVFSGPLPEEPYRHANISDDFRIFPFAINQDSKVLVKLRSASQTNFSDHIEEVTLKRGVYFFVLSYDDVYSVLLSEGEFDVNLIVAPLSHSEEYRESIIWKGFLDSTYRGSMLGNVIQYDTEIFRGNVTLRREDIRISSLGPELNFIRSYNGHKNVDYRSQVLGLGWSHNHRIGLHFIGLFNGNSGYNLPSWVEESRRVFRSTSTMPSQYSNPVYLEAENGGLFRFDGENWIVQSSYHGRLLQFNDQNTNSGLTFKFYSKDNTEYNFDHVDLKVFRPIIDYSLLTFLPKDTLVLNSEKVSSAVRLLPFVAFTKPQSAWVSSIVDKSRNKSNYQYAQTEIGPLLESVTDAVGRKLVFKYSDVFRPDPTNEYNPIRLKTVVGPMNLNLEFGYDKEYFNQNSFKRDNFSETYEYINSQKGLLEQGKFQSQTLRRYQDGLGNATTFYYYSPSEVEHLKKMIPGIPLERVVSSIRYPDMNLAKIKYFPQHNRRELYDLSKLKTEYLLNNFGNPIKTTEPSGRVTAYGWGVDFGLNDNLLLEESVQNENRQSYAYDEQGNQVSKKINGELVELFEWDARTSQPLVKKYSNGIVEEYSYDSHGHVVQFKRGEHIENYKYNSFGQKIEKSVNGKKTTYSYDEFGYVREIKAEGYQDEFYRHDIRGRLLSKTWSDGSWISYGYDNLDRIVSKKESNGQAEFKEYDNKGNVIYQRLDDGTELRFIYNERETVSRVNLSPNMRLFYRYNDASDNILKIDVNGDVITREYGLDGEEVLPDVFKPWTARPIR